MKKLALIVCAFELVARPLPAVAATWALSTGGNWNTDTNWSPQTYPNAVGATATLSNNLASQTIDLTANVTIGSLLADATFSTTDNSHPLTLGTAGRTIIFDNTGSTDAVFSMWTSGGPTRALTVNADLQLNDHLQVATSPGGSAGNWTINGSIFGAGNIIGNLAGIITLKGDNSGWSGNIVSSGAGKFYYDATNQLGAGALGGGGADNVNYVNCSIWRSSASDATLNQALNLGTASANPKILVLGQKKNQRTTVTTSSISGTSGKLQLGSAGDWATASYYTEFTGNFSMSATGGGIDLDGNLSTYLMVAELNSSGTQTVSKITGIGNVVRGRSSGASNSGMTVITGTNSYTGTTTVNGGTLLVNGAHTNGGNYTVAGDATLGGSGTIDPADGKTVTLTGTSGHFATLAPGGSGIGALTIGSATGTNNVVMGDYSALRIRFNGAASSDNLVVNGTLDLSFTADKLVLLGSIAPGNYTVVSATTLGGQFNQVDTSGLVPAANVTSVKMSYPGDGRVVVECNAQRGTLMTIQ